MRSIWKQLAFALLLGVVFPSFLIRSVPVMQNRQPVTNVTSPDIAPESSVPQQGEQTSTMLLPVLMKDGTVQHMDVDAYLTAVVLREMPADFELEALKAQAIVARTYALKRFTEGGKHSENAVCTDSSCCQGYRTEEDYLLSGGSREAVEKVRNAVTSTSGMVLTYQNQLIDATYFSCSGGKTEDAQAVWGSDVPYLQSVDSPGEEHATHYTDTVTFTAEEFATLLGQRLDGAAGTWLEEVTYTEGGGVATIRICGKTYQGTTIRQRLGLRSTAFVMTAVGNTITVTTKGFGHRVGMSQYGADAMAVRGNSCERILAHYYPGTNIVPYG